MRRAWVLGAVLVIGIGVLASGQALTGSWTIDLAINPQSASFIDGITYSTELLVKYTIGDWTFSTLSKLDESGWYDQNFSSIGVLGGFTISTALDFDPDVPEFDKWTTTTTVDIVGVTFSATFELYDEDVFMTLSARGTSGGVDIDVTAKFGDDDEPGECDLDFSSLQIGVDFPFCCADVRSTTYFDCDGFEKIVFDASGIGIANLPWITLDATLEFTVQSKSLTLTPNFVFSAICVEMYVGVETSGNLTLEALHFDGFKLECDVGDVEFTAISFWGDGDFVSKPGALGDFWEMYKIEADEDSCCGPFDFAAAVFFDEESVHLFDVGKFEFDMSIDLSANMEFSIELDYLLGVGVDKLEFGFEATW